MWLMYRGMRKIKSAGAKDLAGAANPEPEKALAAPVSDRQRSEGTTRRWENCTELDPWRGPHIVHCAAEPKEKCLRFHPRQRWRKVANGSHAGDAGLRVRVWVRVQNVL